MEIVLLSALIVIGIVLIYLNVRGGSRETSAHVAQELDKATEKIQKAMREESKENRDELAVSIQRFSQSVNEQITVLSDSQNKNFHVFAQQLTKASDRNDVKMEAVRKTIEERLNLIQEDNNKQLDKMRVTVDEKLHETLEKRLSASFKQVSERLEIVHKGLGEMQTLATGVGDLKKVLQNVKTRGTWGEVQLGNLLADLLTPDQYDENVATKKGSADRVEFAIKLPAKDDADKTIFLPIDAKFPLNDYQGIVEAADAADVDEVERLSKALEMRIKAEAKDIRDKYIDPPYTTDFGIMFLPVEGLYAEVLRRPGLVDLLQREYRVIVTGPITISAIISSLQMGFRTLAIEKRSSEVWEVLGAVKKEFTVFGDILDKTQKKLQEASNTIEKASSKSRTIERKLGKVQELPASSDSVIPGIEE